MALYLDNSKRLLIPSWKPFVRSQDELRPIKFHTRDTGDISPYIKEWRNRKNIISAGELLSSAIVNNRVEEDEVKEAILFINQTDDGIPFPLKNTAKSYTETVPVQTSSLLTGIELFQQIAALKHLISQYPYNAIYHVDIARCYVLLGQLKQAESHINTALYLDSNNRFVVRAASRFYIHIKDEKQALSALRHSCLLKKDPWLMASEISVSRMFKKNTNNVKRAIQLIDSRDYSDFDLSELRSTVGMEEFGSGSYKNGRNLIHKSLLAPCENSIAQAQWIVNNTNVELEAPLVISPYFSEALCYYHYNNADYKAAITSAKNWQADTPYSFKCALYGAGIATIYLKDYSTSIDLLNQYLLTNKQPSEERRKALNDLAYAFALNKKADKAQQVLDSVAGGIDVSSIKRVDICLVATQGLIAFRLGDVEKGKHFYENAIDLSEKRKEKYTKHTAQINYCRELLLSSKCQENKELVTRILEEIPLYNKEVPISVMRKDVEIMLKT